MSKENFVKYNCIDKYVMIVLKTLMRSVFCSSKSLLKSVELFVEEIIGDNNQLNCITPSGRTALNCIFSLPNVHTILMPEYICNVVPMAAHGKKIRYYSVGNDYQISFQEIKRDVCDEPDCCVLLSSYMDRKIHMKEMIQKIRAISQKCLIVFDECQNIQSIKELPIFDDNTFAVYSFNNKMTYGFMGGAIIQGRNNSIIFHKFKPASFADDIHGVYVVLCSGIREIFSAMKRDFCIPEDPDVSQGKGIYSVHYEGILKVSIAAASLLKENWDWYLSCMESNHGIAKQLECAGKVETIQGGSDSLMPYIPIRNDRGLYGKLPLKGRYGGLPHTYDNRNICLKLHNSMKMEIIK